MPFPNKAVEAIVEFYNVHTLFATVFQSETVSLAWIHNDDETQLQLTHS